MRQLALTFLAALLLPGCAGDRQDEGTAAKPVPGTYVEESGITTKFYAEELEGSRLYVFGRKKSHIAFIEDGRRIRNEKMRTLPAKGPLAQVNGNQQRTTLMIEYTPDEPAMENRLRRTVARRFGLELATE